jgi:hypothetical protein
MSDLFPIWSFCDVSLFPSSSWARQGHGNGTRDRRRWNLLLMISFASSYSSSVFSFLWLQLTSLVLTACRSICGKRNCMWCLNGSFCARTPCQYVRIGPQWIFNMRGKPNTTSIVLRELPPDGVSSARWQTGTLHSTPQSMCGINIRIYKKRTDIIIFSPLSCSVWHDDPILYNAVACCCCSTFLGRCICPCDNL